MHGMRKVFSRAFLAVVVAAGGCSGSNSTKDEGINNEAVDRAKTEKKVDGETATNISDSLEQMASGSISLQMAAWIGSTILNKLVNEATVALKHEEVKNDLQLLEAALSRSDSSLAGQVHELQAKLDQTANVDDIRKTIERIVTQLEVRLSSVEAEAKVTEGNVKELTNIIGFVPMVSPSPLLRINLKGEPEAHPLIVKWAKLLSRSHTHWIEMEELNKIYKHNAPEMQAAMETHHQLLQESKDLQIEGKNELAKILLERTKLLQTQRTNHPAVIDFDAKIASLTWLVKIATINQGEDYQGMLVVPDCLVGPYTSDILAAFSLAGADAKGVVPLYRQLMHKLPKADRDDLVPLSAPDQQKIQESYVSLMHKANAGVFEAQYVQAQLDLLTEHRSALDPSVMERQRRKIAQFPEIENIHVQAESLLAEAIAVYVEHLKTFHPEHPEQQRYVKRIVQTLSVLCERSSCFDFSNVTSREDTWRSFTSHDDEMRRTDRFALYFDQQVALGRSPQDIFQNYSSIAELTQILDSSDIGYLHISGAKERENSLKKLRRLGVVGDRYLNNNLYKETCDARLEFYINGSVKLLCDVLIEVRAMAIDAETANFVREIDPRKISLEILQRMKTGRNRKTRIRNIPFADESEMCILLRIIGYLGPNISDLQPVIEDYIRDQDPEIQTAATQALKKISSSTSSPK